MEERKDFFLVLGKPVCEEEVPRRRNTCRKDRIFSGWETEGTGGEKKKYRKIGRTKMIVFAASEAVFFYAI